MPAASPFERPTSHASHGVTESQPPSTSRDAPPPPGFKALTQACFRQAEIQGFPPFVSPERLSTPINATPYLIDLSSLVAGEGLANRRPFIEALAATVRALDAIGGQAVAALLGGSAIGPKPDPGDLDCALFYRWVDGTADAAALKRLQTASRAHGLDLRLLPLDGDPLLLIKTISYFSMLYSKNEGERTIVRGLVLVDCRT